MNFKNIVWFIKAISYFVLLRSLGNNNKSNNNDNYNNNNTCSIRTPYKSSRFSLKKKKMKRKMKKMKNEAKIIVINKKQNYLHSAYPVLFKHFTKIEKENRRY